MITIIIPTLSEQTSISNVVQLVEKVPAVSEILVIANKSLVDTIKNTKSEKVKIHTITKSGKGASMYKGMLQANNEIIVYLDADIITYPQNIINLLTDPIISDKADFVKSFFDRLAGRVTEWVGKPLISLLFPDLAHYSQPLSGVIAGKKSFFEKVSFEDDYGVDIGLLIDMYLINAKISEVNIGYIESRMQSLEELGRMSKEVTRAILKRVELIKQSNCEILENISIINDQMNFAIKETFPGLKNKNSISHCQ